MRRHRTIAAAPVRSASASWNAIAELIVCSLERSPKISRADVEAELGVAAGIGRMLVAGGHLDANPILVTAGKLDLAIRTESGDAALSTVENEGPVPGAADAGDWQICLPAVPPLEKGVEQAVESAEHLSAEDPSKLAKESTDRAGEALDAAALRRWEREGS